LIRGRDGARQGREREREREAIKRMGRKEEGRQVTGGLKKEEK
jgi:hypothetical protein